MIFVETLGTMKKIICKILRLYRLDKVFSVYINKYKKEIAENFKFVYFTLEKIHTIWMKMHKNNIKNLQNELIKS